MALPASGYLSDESRTNAEMKQALEDLRDAVAVAGGEVDDALVIYNAQSGNSTLSYTLGQLTGITYTDTADFTSNTKTLAYTGSQLDSITHVFTYSGETWTVTTTLAYSGGSLSTKTISVVKV